MKKFKYELPWEAASEIVKVALREDAAILKREIKDMEKRKSLSDAQIKDLHMDRKFLEAINMLKDYYSF